MGKPIFISYKRVDLDRVISIRDRIEAETRAECWIDTDGIESDAQFMNVIIEAIKDCEIFLFFYSKSHLIRKDAMDWPMRELNFAERKLKRIVLIHLDDTELTDELLFKYDSKQQIYAKKASSIQNLIRDINKWLGNLENDTEAMTASKDDSKKESNDKGRVWANMWNKAQETVAKTQEAYKNIVPDFKEVKFSKDKELPKSFAIDTEDGKLYFVLSEDGKFYLANVASKSDNFKWWNNKTIAIVGASALLAGAPVLAVVGFGLAGLTKLLFPNFSSKFFGGKRKSTETPGMKASKELCDELSKATGYVIDLPKDNELTGVVDDAKGCCIVIRVGENDNLFQKHYWLA